MIKKPEPLQDRLHQVVTPYARANARLYSKKSKGNSQGSITWSRLQKQNKPKRQILLVYGFKLKTGKLEKIK